MSGSDRQMPLGGWKELESDPGLFTLLVKDFGVQGVQVEEVYDLQRPLSGRVYGFIFLFKWSEVGRCRRKMQIGQDEPFCRDEDTVNGMFFAHQLIPNSCATHALLSILLNCEDVTLGSVITRLKETCKSYDPETKGFAIANMPELACVHNKHAHPETNPLSDSLRDKPNGITPSARTLEAFHYTCYLPLDGHLFELDGLKPYPIDHGPLSESEAWHDRARHVINDRISVATGGEQCHDIRYNLMAVVPSRVELYENKLTALAEHHKILSDAIEEVMPNLNLDEEARKELTDIVRDTRENVKDTPSKVENKAPGSLSPSESTDTASEFDSPSKSARGSPNLEKSSQAGSSKTHCNTLSDILTLIKEREMLADISSMNSDGSESIKLDLDSLRDVQRVLHNLDTSIKMCRLSLKDEHDKLRKYGVDAARRTHNYDPFIRMFLSMLAERGMLNDLIEDNLIVKRKAPTSNGKLQKSTKKQEQKKKRKR